MAVNRRDWIQTILAGTAGLVVSKFGLAQGKPSLQFPSIQSTINGVPIGCNTYSLSRLSLDDCMRLIAAVGIGVAELHPCHIEPSFGRGGTVPSPSPQSGKNLNRREKLRQWRLTVPLEEFHEIGRKFRNAGIYIYAYNMNFPADDFTESEIERTFEITNALGAQIMVPAVGSSATIPRLDPFARKHKIRYGIHNEDSIRTPQDLDRIRKGLSDYAAITLDIGHLIANGGDPIDYLNKHQDDIINLHIKDRRRHNGSECLLAMGIHRSKRSSVCSASENTRFPPRSSMKTSMSSQRKAFVRHSNIADKPCSGITRNRMSRNWFSVPNALIPGLHSPLESEVYPLERRLRILHR
jgi:sugar phosphate isomerase/epimerase